MNSMITRIFIAVATLAWVGCQSARLDHKEVFTNTVTLIGTYDRLAQGGFDSMTTVSNVLSHGDFGLGTFEGLDGEMILTDGVMYRADRDGNLHRVPPETGVPFAAVTWFEPDRFVDLSDVSLSRFQRALNVQRGADVYPIAIRAQATFDWLLTRSVGPQTPPYPSLAEALTGQVEVKRENLSGTLVGYYFPSMVKAFQPAGYHFHFISDDRTVGGHVLNFHLIQARVEFDPAERMYVYLPTDESPYRLRGGGLRPESSQRVLDRR